MIKAITVTTPKGESLKLTLANPEESGLIVKSIEGLGPSKANINTTELATMDGSVYSSARTMERNIVLTLAMMFAPTIEDSRQKTYHFFPVKGKVKLVIETDNRQVQTEGYVESNEPDIFSEAETAQISILCPDPYFYDASGSSTLFMDASAQFEFPFSNESVTEPMIEFSIIRIDSRAIINYEGDSDTGLIITLHPVATVSDITLYNVTTEESMAIDTDKITAITGTAFAPGDDIIISTIKGDKYVRLLRNGFYTNIISALAKDADWLQITPGDNIFDFTTDSAETKTNLMVTFSYRKAYGGV